MLRWRPGVDSDSRFFVAAACALLTLLLMTVLSSTVALELRCEAVGFGAGCWFVTDGKRGGQA
jgi:hypothetical protein